MNTNTETVMGIYAAFGRGDVEYILDRMRDDVRWDEGLRDTGLPYLRPGTGKQHVIEFFTALAENVEFTMFEPGVPCASDDTVMIAIREAGRNIKTGAVIAEDLQVHIWTLDGDGKIASLRHVGDLSSHVAAASAVPAAVK